VAANFRSRSYFKVLTRFAGCVPSCVLGICIVTLYVGTSGQCACVQSLTTLPRGSSAEAPHYDTMW
jgi:hypothetical protein